MMYEPLDNPLTRLTRLDDNPTASAIKRAQSFTHHPPLEEEHSGANMALRVLPPQTHPARQPDQQQLANLSEP